jgi:hypothetical protein
MEEKLEIRETFLKLFIRELISNVEVSPEEFEEVKKNGLGEEMNPSMFREKEPLKRKKEKILMKSVTPMTKSVKKSNFEKPKKINERGKVKIRKRIEKKTTSNLPESSGTKKEKINQLLRDRRINRINCQGPEKRITVIVNGIPKMTNIQLSEEEIKSVIEDFSNLTKIPLISNVFKAAYHNLLISAITSEFVGSRFIIIKK